MNRPASTDPGLCQQAEAIAREKAAQSAESSDSMLPEELRLLLHESRVHQAELELQNDELSRALTTLRESEERYRTAFRVSPNAVTITRLADGLYLDVNDGFARTYGWARDEVIGKTAQEIGIWKDLAHRQSLVDILLRDGYCESFEAELLSRDGKEVAVLVSAHLFMIESEPCLLTITHNITERKRALDALREQKEFFHLITESLSDFIAVLDLDGRRIYNSPSYKQHFGVNSDLRGTDSFDQVHPDDRERVKTIFDETVKTGQGHQLEYRLVTPEGGVRTMESRGRVMRNRAGSVTRVVVVSHDITERKLMEDQVRQMAFHDTLTRLPNRRLFSDRLAQTMAATSRSGYYGAVMFLDLDDFKSLNDRYGHDVGDSLLIEAAERLKGCVRDMDTVARFGGDEFVVMISELATDKIESIAEAGIIAEKIRFRLAEPYRLSVKRMGETEETVEHLCTASIGVLLFIGQETSQENILKWADAAMYLAKEGGCNSFRFVELESDHALRPEVGVCSSGSSPKAN